MRRAKITLLSATLGLALAMLGSQARAQEARPQAKDSKDGYSYEFSDDPLAASGIVPSGGGITVRFRTMRGLLIRPRTQFIVQMLKSVEDL